MCTGKINCILPVAVYGFGYLNIQVQVKECVYVCMHAYTQAEKGEKETNQTRLKLNGKDKFRHNYSCEVKTKVPISLVIWKTIQ